MAYQNDRITAIPAPLPKDYDRGYSFTDFQTINPGKPASGAALDNEFANIEQALDETQARLRLIQRDDGALANDSVGEDQLVADIVLQSELTAAVDALEATDANLQTQINARATQTALNQEILDRQNADSALQNDVNLRLRISDVIDGLSSTATQKALSANQGRVLNEGLNLRLPISHVVDALNSTETQKALSANQGRVLNNKIGLLEPSTDPEAKNKVTALSDITSLSSLNTAALVDEQQFKRKEFWPGTGVGGADLYWDAFRDVSEHNGGTIIDPAKISELNTTTKTFGTYFTPDTVSGNTGCFVVEDSQDATAFLWGALNLAGFDNHQVLEKAVNRVGKTLYIDNVLLPVSEEISITESGVSLIGRNGGGLIAETADIYCVSVAANDVEVAVTIDCASLARVGVAVYNPSERYDVNDCKISNVRSETAQAFGVLSQSAYGGKIHHNEIRSVFSLGDGTSGNGNGLSRAIQYVPDETPVGQTFIEHNKMYNVLGEEGDMISVQVNPPDWNGVLPYPDSKTSIKHNYGENWTRRGIKNQGSNTYIYDNEFRTLDSAPTGIGQSYTISIIASDDCLVEDNYVDGGGKYGAWNCDGSNVHINARCQFIDNKGENLWSGALVNIRQSVDCVMSGGRLRNSNGGWIGVLFSDTQRCAVEDVKFYGTTTAELVAISTDCSDTGVLVNKSFCVSARRFIQAPAPKSLVLDNKSFGTVYSAGVYSGNNPLSINSVVKRNIAISPAAELLVGYFGSETHISENISLDGSSWGVNAEVFWTNGDPAVTQPSIFHGLGSLAINYAAASSGNVALYQCTLSGTPGTWEPIVTLP